MTAVLRNRFSELQQTRGRSKAKTKGGKDADTNAIVSKRTSMKDTAKDGSGPFFGLEDRYDGASIGLSPLLYWSKDNFQRVRRTFVVNLGDDTTAGEDADGRQFRVAKYARRNQS